MQLVDVSEITDPADTHTHSHTYDWWLIDPGPGDPGVSNGLQQATFIEWSPLGNVSKYINNGRVPNGVVEDKDPVGPAVSDGS